MLLAAAVSTDALERFTSYRRGHEKALFAALGKLEQLRERKSALTSDNGGSWNDRFSSEDACEEHLRQRFFSAEWRCPHCGHQRGSWLAQRQRWECRGCGRQVGLRSGTVLANSGLPLRVWFRAIALLASHPEVDPAEVGRVTGVARRGTIARLIERILAGLGSPDRRRLLAGIDQLAYPGIPESAAANPGKSQNELTRSCPPAVTEQESVEELNSS